MATVQSETFEGLDREQKFSRWLPGLLHVLNTHRTHIGVQVEDLRQIDDHGKKIRQALAARDERRKAVEAYEADLEELEARHELERERVMSRIREATHALERAQDTAELVVTLAARTINPITDAMREKRLVPEFLLSTLGLDDEESPLKSATPAPVYAPKPAAPTAPPALHVRRVNSKFFLLLWEDAHRTDDTRYEAVVRYRAILSTMSYRGRVREVPSEQETTETVSLYGSKTEYIADRAALSTPISFELIATDPSGQTRTAAVVHMTID